MVAPLYLGSSVSAIQNTQLFTPDNAAISYSDYCAISVSALRARFTRPTVDGQGFETCSPGARVRFKTNSLYVRLRLRYTNLVTRLDTYNAVGAVLVDGSPQYDFDRTQGSATSYQVSVSFGTVATRTIELVLPYCASVDFEGVDLLVGSTISAAAARPTTRFVAMGDSITHGFDATKVRTAWSYMLALAKTWQYINHGYGGRRVTPADGDTLRTLNPTVATYLIGYNDFAGQVPLDAFKFEYISFLTNFRASGSTAKLYCLTPVYSPNTGTLTLENYRQQIRDALTAVGNVKNVLVEGTTLFTNSSDRLVDTIHPNDTGCAEMATALAAIVSP